MRKANSLQRFDAALQAFVSSRRALGRAMQMDEYVLQHLRRYLIRAGSSDLDAVSFERWRRRLRHAAHNTQVDWAMMVYRFCRYRRLRERRCFVPERVALGRHRPYPLPTPIEPEQVQRLLRYASRVRGGAPPLRRAAHRLVIVLSRGGEPIACLARRFPHVVNDLASLWREPASVVHRIDELLVDRRGGRRGFPADALAELLALRRAALKRSVSPASAVSAATGAKG